MRSNVKKTGIIVIAVIVILISALWFTGLIGLWTTGMKFVANNTNEFTDKSGHIIQGEYSVLINLDDLQSNVGKELYNDGKNRIYVEWVDNSGSISSGGYSIGFRACGQYSLTNATLISGVHHATVNGNSFSADMSAKMMAKYNDKVYNCGVFGTSGLNYKNGDDFAFYIFPSECYKNGEISLNEKGTVNLIITNLYKNVWTKK